MSDFADVERFAREHAACGGLTPSAMPRPGGGGYLLTLTCACGSSFDRWVSPEEARRPLPILPRAPQPSPAGPTLEPPPSPAAAPVSAGPAASPAPGPRRAPGRPPASSKPKPRPSEELEALVREALAAEESTATEPPPAPVAAPATAGESPRPVGRARPAPERLNLDTTIRSALQQHAELTLPPPPRPRRASRGRAVWLALFLIVGLGAAATIYVAGDPEGRLPLTAPGPPPTRTSDPQRAALEGVVKSLRDLHSVATSTTSVSVYSTRVTAAKNEAERYLVASPPGATRTRVREALDIHILAVSAWRAKSLDQKEAWEAVGLDPSIDLCPPLRLVADFAVQAENASRAQTRGAAVASALPLLWECANERIAALELTLAGR